MEGGKAVVELFECLLCAGVGAEFGEFGAESIEKSWSRTRRMFSSEV